MGEYGFEAKAIIEFDENYNNKLDNKLFTTVRKFSIKKQRYYKRKTGSQFDIMLKGKKYSTAILSGIAFIGELSEISQIELMLDTGLSGQGQNYELFNKFGVKPNDKIIQLLFDGGLNGWIC